MTDMPRRDITPVDKIALVEKIKSQPPNTSHHQLAEINGVPKSTTAQIAIARLGVLRRLVWTVYQFCTMLKKMRG
jgi:hypothetical protein